MVPVNRVYQTVLTLLNKEQRGFLPPEAFNQFAQQAQVELFENYFWELGRAEGQYGPLDDMYANIPANIMEKLEEFETTFEPVSGVEISDGSFDLPINLYRLQAITLNNIEVIKKKHSEIGYMTRSPLMAPTIGAPNYVRTGETIQIYPTDVTEGVVVNYIRELGGLVPNWDGAVFNGQLVPNSATSTDFQLHSSEEPELVAKILGYAGLSVKAQDVMTAGATITAAIQQNEQ